ncbi:acyl carrier protein [Agrobacterium tumefaciens]|uniref:acyl carrier protein n=1 Tax=Agrobacterium tumefaciens TaxID=358 RepID=UPI0034580430
MGSIEGRIVKVISEVFDVPRSDISLADTADDVDGWDSLSHVTLMLSLSREFGIHLEPAETETLSNIQGLVDVVYQKLNTK